MYSVCRKKCKHNTANCQIHRSISIEVMRTTFAFIPIGRIFRMSSHGDKDDSILVIASPKLTPLGILELDKFTDVTLVCGASKIRAHKCVLRVSGYFDEFFKRNKTCTEIVLDIDFEDLKCIIVYMYQGRIVIPVERRESFMKYARMFDVAIEANNIVSVDTRMEKVFGNGEAFTCVQCSSIDFNCSSFARFYLEYNESNFQQVTAAHVHSDEARSSRPEIVRVQFNRKSQQQIMPKSSNPAKNRKKGHRRQNDHQSEFLEAINLLNPK